MDMLRLLLSPAGTLPPRPFLSAAGAVYFAGLLSQWLTAPPVVARAWLWPFLIVLAVLLWSWLALHAQRLRDGRRPITLAVVAAALYAVAVALVLVPIAAALTSPPGGASADPNANSALTLILFVWVIAVLSGSPSFDWVWFGVAIVAVMALLPVVVALAVTAWTATRPGGR